MITESSLLSAAGQGQSGLVFSSGYFGEIRCSLISHPSTVGTQTSFHKTIFRINSILKNLGSISSTRSDFNTTNIQRVTNTLVVTATEIRSLQRERNSNHAVGLVGNVEILDGRSSFNFSSFSILGSKRSIISSSISNCTLQECEIILSANGVGQNHSLCIRSKQRTGNSQSGNQSNNLLHNHYFLCHDQMCKSS